MSSDATPSGAFLSVPDPRTARCSLMAPSPKPRNAPAALITVSQLTKPPHPVTSASSSVSPSLFASPSRAPTFKRRDQAIVHNPAISTAKEGVVEHSPLSCEHENHANPGDPYLWERARAATFRCALLVPITTAPYRCVRLDAPSVCMYTYAV
jgi:hypothetical protein